MASSPERLHTLFRRYYSGAATPAETDELMALIRLSQDDNDLADALWLAWEDLHPGSSHFSADESRQMLGTILPREAAEESGSETYRLGWWRYVAAAIILIISGLIFYQYKHQPSPKGQAVASKAMADDVPPGGNRALLTLADGSDIILDSARNGVLAQQGSSQILKTDAGQLAIKTGGIPEKNHLNFNTLSTPKGGQYQIVLDDGTKIWLNASSSIRFPTRFAEAERRVEISGEVYFEVSKDKKRPFRVKFGDSEVEVLGTSFNIMAYPDETVSKTTLVEGSVRLKTTGKSQMLVPGQQGSILSNGTILTASVDTDRETAWKKGLFYFRDSGIEEIMRDASRWYDIEVVYEGKMHRRQFTGKVSRNVNISELLNMLRYAGVNSRIENKKVMISM